MEFYRLETSTKIIFPFFDNRIPAGFPSPAMDYSEQKLDLKEYLMPHENSTFIVRVKGSSMIDDGINDDDLLIVDKSLRICMGQIVIAELNGEFTVKRIEKIKGKLFLVAANKKFEPIAINEETELMIWGIVNFTIHKTM